MQIESIIERNEQDMQNVLPAAQEFGELRLIFPPKPIAVRAGLRSIVTALDETGLSLEERGTIELVLAEALNNITEHAFDADADGIIEVQARFFAGGIAFDVFDDGSPMPNGQAPLGVQADLTCDLTELPEGGFGWFLIGELARDLIYTRKDDRNWLQFKMLVGPRMRAI